MQRFQLTLIFALILVFGCQQGGPVISQGTRQWTPNESQVAQLQPRSKYEKYSIQLPADFKEQSNSSTVKKTQMFSSKNGPTNIAIEYGAMLYGGSKKPSTSQELVLIMSKSLSRELNDFQQSPPEVGLIGDIEFARKTWSGSASGSQISGTMYTAVIDGEMVVISVQNLGAERSSEFDIAEAAVYTFQPE